MRNASCSPVRQETVSLPGTDRLNWSFKSRCLNIVAICSEEQRERLLQDEFFSFKRFKNTKNIYLKKRHLRYSPGRSASPLLTNNTFKCRRRSRRRCCFRKHRLLDCRKHSLCRCHLDSHWTRRRSWVTVSQESRHHCYLATLPQNFDIALQRPQGVSWEGKKRSLRVNRFSWCTWCKRRVPSERAKNFTQWNLRNTQSKKKQTINITLL